MGGVGFGLGGENKLAVGVDVESITRRLIIKGKCAYDEVGINIWRDYKKEDQ